MDEIIPKDEAELALERNSNTADAIGDAALKFFADRGFNSCVLIKPRRSEGRVRVFMADHLETRMFSDFKQVEMFVEVWDGYERIKYKAYEKLKELYDEPKREQ